MGASSGFWTLGDHYPLLTPQGPRFVGSLRFLLSWGRWLRDFKLFSLSFSEFLESLLSNPYSLISLALTSFFHVSVLILHGFPLLFSMCFHSVYFPLPCVQFFSSSFSHILASIWSHLCSLFFASVPLRDSFVLRFMFSPLPVRLCFPYPLWFLSPSFRLVFPISVLPLPPHPQMIWLFPEALSNFGFTASFSRLGFCGPRVVTSTPTPLHRSSKVLRVGCGS